MLDKKLKIGLIGLGQRGVGLLETYLISQTDIDLTYVCDLYRDRAEDTADKIRRIKGDSPIWATDYKEVLKSDVDAVIVATSWETHMQVTIDALKAGKITGMEVGGAYSVEECWELITVYEQTKTPIMLLENCCYNDEELLALKLVREGILGEVVHCSGAYSHDLRNEVAFGKENRHYRLQNYLTRNCENYPTHELGPIAKIMDINRGNRMVSLVSVASKAAGMEQYIKNNSDKVDITASNFCSAYW